MIVDALFDHARTSGNADVLDFAEQLYLDFSAGDTNWEDSDGQLFRLLSEDPAVGHGAHTAEHLRVPLGLRDRRPDFAVAFERGIEKVRRGLGIGGALKSDEAIATPGSEPYPLPEAGYEICTMFELMTSALEAARITGDFAYLDMAERIFLNDAQAAIANDGRTTAYCVAQNQAAATHRMGTRWDFSPTHDDVAVCCPPNAGKILPAFTRRMVVTAPGLISVQLYGPSTATVDLDGSTVRLRQETDYPFDERVRIRVDGGGTSCGIELRIPGWCSAPDLTLNGVPGAVIERLDDRIRIDAEWPDGAVLELVLPQETGLIRSVDGRSAVTHGPLLYSVPIPFDAIPYRVYCDGWADLDLVPSSTEWMYPPVLVADLSDAEMRRTPVGSDPWTDPPWSIRVAALNPNPTDDPFYGGGTQTIELSPYGSTSLRWTAFASV